MCWKNRQLDRGLTQLVGARELEQVTPNTSNSLVRQEMGTPVKERDR